MMCSVKYELPCFQEIKQLVSIGLRSTRLPLRKRHLTNSILFYFVENIVNIGLNVTDYELWHNLPQWKYPFILK